MLTGFRLLLLVVQAYGTYLYATTNDALLGTIALISAAITIVWIGRDFYQEYRRSE